MKRVTQNCRACGKALTGRNIRYCNNACKAAHNRTAHGYKTKGQYQRDPQICPCGKIVPYAKWLDGRQKYCSISCGASASNRRRRVSTSTKGKLRDAVVGGPDWVENHGTRNSNLMRIAPKPLNEYRCHRCGKTFLAKKDKRYCSMNCSGGSNKKRYEYNGIILDSSWEVALAKLLDSVSEPWERPGAFKLKSGRMYSPDFYLVNHKMYIETKARAYFKRYDLALAKIEQFVLEYGVPCIVISNMKMIKWGIIAPLLKTKGMIVVE